MLQHQNQQWGNQLTIWTSAFLRALYASSRFPKYYPQNKTPKIKYSTGVDHHHHHHHHQSHPWRFLYTELQWIWLLELKCFCCHESQQQHPMNAFYTHILQEEGSAEDGDQKVAAASVVVAERNPTCSKNRIYFLLQKSNLSVSSSIKIKEMQQAWERERERERNSQPKEAWSD